DRDFAEVKDAGSKRCVGFAKHKRVHEVTRFSGAAGGNDRNGKQFVQLGQRVDIKALLCSVVIHTRKEDFTRAAVLAFLSPGEETFVCCLLSAVGVDNPDVANLTGVNG